jgi:agmatinase
MLLSGATGSEQFLGSEAIATYATAKAVILPIPYEATTTYRKGCETGPAAVITASQQLEAYDEELKRETCLEVGIYTHDAIADTRQQPQLSAEEMLAVTTATVSRLIADDKFVVAVGGEHAITTGVVQAYRQALSDPFTVVQIDAHGDMRFEYEGSHHNHACVMRRVLEMGLPTLPVGIRAICREEAELIAKQQIPVIWDRDIARDAELCCFRQHNFQEPPTSITSPGETLSNTLQASGIRGSKSESLLLVATRTITATPVCCKFC